MVRRTLQDNLLDAAAGFPVITITGPRQSGKTTLAKMAFPGYKYLDLEQLALRRIMTEDPLSILSDPLGHYIIDEFQYVPELLSYVKVMVDNSGLQAQFILTGSNQFVMMQGLSQSLAGRTAIFELLPFSFSEAHSDFKNVDSVIHKGFYPRLIDKNMRPDAFYNAYLSTYLQRDIRLLSNVQNLDTFNRFISLCAGRTGSILNKVALANDVGVDAKTVSNWLSLLQTSYIIHLLQPWHTNQNKRLIKSPKLYFYDTGLACNLLGIRDEADLKNHPLRGNLFETMIVAEALKFFHNRGIRPPLHYYRESGGLEIDLLISMGNRHLPVEIKSAGLVNPSFYSSLNKYMNQNNEAEAWLIYSGTDSWKSKNITILSPETLSAKLQPVFV
jgi:hypothetical protein